MSVTLTEHEIKMLLTALHYARDFCVASAERYIGSESRYDANQRNAWYGRANEIRALEQRFRERARYPLELVVE